MIGNKETSEEKAKSPRQKGPVLQKGRFSVTSDDVNLEVTQSNAPLLLPNPLKFICCRSNDVMYYG